jgi:hypothetical protein
MDVYGHPNGSEWTSNYFLAGPGRGSRWHTKQPAACRARARGYGQHHQTQPPNRNAFVNDFFNASAFVNPNNLPPGAYGNSGRGLISGPGFANTDFSVLRDFPFGERLRLQFRTEMFNLFNQVNFSLPNSYANSALVNSDGTLSNGGTFGQIQSTVSGTGRQFNLPLNSCGSAAPTLGSQTRSFAGSNAKPASRWRCLSG